jgi:ankyrin repeat protein
LAKQAECNKRFVAELGKGDAFGVRFELARGANPNLHNRRGLSVLQIAASKGLLLVVEALLDAGAEIDAQDPAGDTALHYAMAAEHQGVIDLLVQRHADVYAKNKAGQRPVDIGPDTLRQHLVDISKVEL